MIGAAGEPSAWVVTSASVISMKGHESFYILKLAALVRRGARSAVTWGIEWSNASVDKLK